ncbi:hypothetical protein N7507_004593 [Penicillium longicatenatum]|nr:hypothetical protein N7507_004593 [Penicillium longicatenatum]
MSDNSNKPAGDPTPATPPTDSTSEIPDQGNSGGSNHDGKDDQHDQHGQHDKDDKDDKGDTTLDKGKGTVTLYKVFKNKNQDKDNRKEPKESSVFTYEKDKFLGGTLSSFLKGIVEEKHLGKS